MIDSTTAVNHDTRGKPESWRRVMNSADRAMTNALRRIGGEDWQRRNRTGQRIDARALPFLPLDADARPFERVSPANVGRPDLGIFVLIDASGSMAAQVEVPVSGGSMRRSEAARLIACGIGAAAQRAGFGFGCASHGTQCSATGGERMRFVTHSSTESVLIPCPFSDNWDAPAVAFAAKNLQMPAKRTLFMLLCDGGPTIEAEQHGQIASYAMRKLKDQGAAFTVCFIGSQCESKAGVSLLARDWGTRAVADCSRDLSQMTTKAIQAMSALR
jgi:Mg-chelatase subunit ChlD